MLMQWNWRGPGNVQREVSDCVGHIRPSLPCCQPMDSTHGGWPPAGDTGWRGHRLAAVNEAAAPGPAPQDPNDERWVFLGTWRSGGLFRSADSSCYEEQILGVGIRLPDPSARHTWA